MPLFSSITFYVLQAQDLYTLGLDFATGHLDSACPFLAVASRDLDDSLFSVGNRIRLDLQANGGIVVVGYVYRLRTEAQDGVFANVDGDLGEWVIGLLHPPRPFNHLFGPEAKETVSALDEGCHRTYHVHFPAGR
jgi:hypothetical protein